MCCVLGFGSTHPENAALIYHSLWLFPGPGLSNSSFSSNSLDPNWALSPFLGAVSSSILPGPRPPHFNGNSESCETFTKDPRFLSDSAGNWTSPSQLAATSCHITIMPDLLDDEVNDFFKNPNIRPNPSDFMFLYVLLTRIAEHSDGRLNNNGPFLLRMIFDPEQGPSLREKLGKAWKEKKYQSIRDIGRI